LWIFEHFHIGYLRATTKRVNLTKLLQICRANRAKNTTKAGAEFARGVKMLFPVRLPQGMQGILKIQNGGALKGFN
jgi:hypothetical protein